MSKSVVRKSPDHLGSVRFSTYIEASALDLDKGQRGERSRLKLMAAGARLLDRCSFQDLKIEDVSIEAGVAKGTFYIYFASKDEFLRELATAYCGFESNTLPRYAAHATRFASACSWIGWYERTFASNAGILRCVVQMGEYDAPMRDLWLQRNARVVQAMLSDIVRGASLSPGEQDLMLWALRTVGGMLDQSLFDRYGLQTPSGLEDPVDAELLVEMHAILAYRAIYGEEPPAEEITRATALRQLGRQLSP
jgi:AcrR family transcriptional regulator